MVLCINVSVYTLAAVLSNLLGFVVGTWFVEGQANVLLQLSRMEP